MKIKKPMLIILIIIGSVIVLFFAGRTYNAVQFSHEVKTLFSQSGQVSGKKFSYTQIQSLPDPVQRYFRFALKEGSPYISYARLRHGGQFKTGPSKEWVDIKGEQYFTTQIPGFIWKGSTAMFTARDMYLSNRGKLTVSLFSLFRIAGGQGEKYDQGELLRWLAESVWFPTNLLPGDNLHWMPVDSTSAQLNFTYNNISLSYLVSFDTSGAITEFKTKRYMNENDLETWVGKVSDYKEKEGMMIPFAIEALYQLKDGDYSYAKFHVNEIEYNVPEKY
ncbi:MAG: hypothetical protein LC128_08725 [Chitinophagales bacterium]|nr:hypothetical protein [Chitinophagales bacterium]